MKKAIVSLANDKGNYRLSLARLEESLKGRFDGDFFGFTGEHMVGAPPHEENPYAFKVYAIDMVRQMGYDYILWLDSSVYAIKDVQPVFDIIARDGYLMQDSGHVVGHWCNDGTLEYFRLSREMAMSKPMYGNAGMLGLDFTTALSFGDKKKPYSWFMIWKQTMERGFFKGSWGNHRHDMTCGSIIANELGMKYIPGDQILQYAGPDDPVNNETIIFKAQGM